MNWNFRVTAYREDGEIAFCETAANEEAVKRRIRWAVARDGATHIEIEDREAGTCRMVPVTPKDRRQLVAEYNRMMEGAE